jgi:hypothetical protein
VGEIKIRLVAGLETEEPVAKKFLALPNDIQSPIWGVNEWNTFGMEMRNAEAKCTKHRAHQGTNQR